MRLRFALVAGTTLIVTACAMGRPVPTATTFSIEPAPARPESSEAAHPERLRVDRVRVVAPYDRAALVYRLSAVRYVSDPYQTFLADPGPMLGNRVAEWLAEAQLFKGVAGPGSAAPAPLVLEVTVTELYGDFQDDSSPVAVMSMRCTLIDQRSVRPTVIYERAITRHVPLSKASSEALVRGYDAALTEILLQLARDLSPPIAQ